MTVACRSRPVQFRDAGRLGKVPVVIGPDVLDTHIFESKGHDKRIGLFGRIH